ncbi:hypothetical protein C8Q70DRAFT_511127 [Cubamyces menziesii]|nr:hypothetical protein C8Q70DRAFT_511127 [Cubamyces menziesii]
MTRQERTESARVQLSVVAPVIHYHSSPIPTLPTSRKMTPQPPISDSAVVARAIIQSSKLTDQQKRNVYESTLFAQAAADKAHPPTTEQEAIAWYRNYTNTLGSIGWVVQQANFTEVQYNATQGVINETVLDALANDSDVTKQLLSSVSKGMVAYALAGTDSTAANVFDEMSISSSSNFVSFQIGVASADGDNVVLTLWAYIYSSSKDIDSALWYRWNNVKLSMKSSKLVMTLNNGVYSQVSEIIHNKLDAAGKLDSIVYL